MNGRVAKKLRKATNYVPRKSHIRFKRMYNILKEMYEELPHNQRNKFLLKLTQ